MENIEQLLASAQGEGVTIDGIKPVEIASRGIGIVATRNLKVLYPSSPPPPPEPPCHLLFIELTQLASAEM